MNLWMVLYTFGLTWIATYENYYYVYTYAVELGMSNETVAY